MNSKTILARVALLWILIAQMVYVCLGARTTKTLSRLEANYAFAPSADHKRALDDEFERTASYESRRALVRFSILLAVDSLLIALFWNYGVRKNLARPANVSAGSGAAPIHEPVTAAPMASTPISAPGSP